MLDKYNSWYNIIIGQYKRHKFQNFEFRIEQKKQNTLQMILCEFEIDHYRNQN